MKLNFTKVIIVAAAAVTVLSSCVSKFNEVVNSRDPQLIYDTAMANFEEGKYHRSIVMFGVCSPYVAGTAREDSVAYFIGTAYYKMGDFASSGQSFQDFRRRYTRSPLLEDVEYMYALSFYYDTRPANRDQTATERALMAINEYLSRYPESVKKEYLDEIIEELTFRLHDKEYINAKLYYDIGQYRAANVALVSAIDAYPDSRHREELMFLTVKSNYIYARNSVEYMQRDRYLAMMDAYYTYTAEYPEGNDREEADQMQEEARQYLAQFNIEEENGSEEE